MCHNPTSHPPVFGPALTPVASSDVRVLTSSDGTRFSAFHAVPEQPHGASVLVLPDNRGLSGFYEDLCVRLAEQGHPALAIDYFGRTAGTEHQARGADFPFMEHLFKLSRETLFEDIHAGIAALRDESARQRNATPASDVVTLGFCFGGRQAFLTAAPEFGTTGAIGFYGFPDELFGAPGPTQLAAGFTAPVLGLFGGADAGISAEHVAAFEHALSGVRHEIVTYPGMPHGFFDAPEEREDGAGGGGGGHNGESGEADADAAVAADAAGAAADPNGSADPSASPSADPSPSASPNPNANPNANAGPNANANTVANAAVAAGGAATADPNADTDPTVNADPNANATAARARAAACADAWQRVLNFLASRQSTAT